MNKLNEMIANGECKKITNAEAFKRIWSDAYKSTLAKSVIFLIFAWASLASVVLTPWFLAYVGAHLLTTGIFYFVFCKGQYQMEEQCRAIKAKSP